MILEYPARDVLSAIGRIEAVSTADSPQNDRFLFHFKLVYEAIIIVGTYNGSEYTKILLEVHNYLSKMRAFISMG